MGFRRAILAGIAMLALAFQTFGPGSMAFADDSAPVDPRTVVARAEALPPGSINELKAIDIGGIKQWISVRGTSPANPILLFIHGGPGSTMMPESWAFQRAWEDYFTVVQWDQRGTGKTLVSAGLKPDPDMSVERMQADTEELIQYLRHTYGKDKIFVLGHSWGSILGLKAAQRHPEWLYAYIGVSQVVNGRRNEEVGYAETLAEAKEQQNTTAVSELEALAPYPGPDLNSLLHKVGTERKWNLMLGGLIYGQSRDDRNVLDALSPEYTDADAAAVLVGERLSQRALVPGALDVNFDNFTDYQCPIFIIAGAHDRTTPTSVASEYFSRIHAPGKRFFLIRHAAHTIFDEAPGEVLVNFVEYIRPLAQAPGANP
jgi:proline iminopeptidase